VSYTTGVVAPQVVKINYSKTAPYIHLQSLPHINVRPKIAPTHFLSARNATSHLGLFYSVDKYRCFAAVRKVDEFCIY